MYSRQNDEMDDLKCGEKLLIASHPLLRPVPMMATQNPAILPIHCSSRSRWWCTRLAVAAISVSLFSLIVSLNILAPPSLLNQGVYRSILPTSFGSSIRYSFQHHHQKRPSHTPWSSFEISSSLRNRPQSQKIPPILRVRSSAGETQDDQQGQEAFADNFNADFPGMDEQVAAAAVQEKDDGEEDLFAGPWFDDVDTNALADGDFIHELTNADIDKLFAEAQVEAQDSDQKRKEMLENGMQWWDETESGPASEGKDGLWPVFDGPDSRQPDFADPVLDRIDARREPEKKIRHIAEKAIFHENETFTKETVDFMWKQMEPGRLFGLEPANEGDTIPPETRLFYYHQGNDTQIKTNASQLFLHDTWALFGLHGAFLPQDTKHIEHIQEWAPYLYKNGIRPAIISTNDVYTLQSWKEQLQMDSRIEVVSDADGELAACLGLLNNTPLGMRNDRYAVLVHNGTIYHLRYEDPNDEIMETLPGPLVQTYKKHVVNMMNQTAEFLQVLTDYNAFIKASEKENWYQSKETQKQKKRYMEIKLAEEELQGGGNMRMVSDKKDEQKLPGWSPPKKAEDKNPHDTISSDRPPRLPTKYQDILERYPHDDTMDDM